MATIIPILKGAKDAKLPTNYRPISLLNEFTKILETLLKEEIMDFTEEQHLLPPQQFGFRRNLASCKSRSPQEGKNITNSAFGSPQSV